MSPVIDSLKDLILHKLVKPCDAWLRASAGKLLLVVAAFLTLSSIASSVWSAIVSHHFRWNNRQTFNYISNEQVSEFGGTQMKRQTHIWLVLIFGIFIVVRSFGLWPTLPLG
jgi:hypothetical protein